MEKTKNGRRKDNHPLFYIFDILVTVFSYFLAYFIINFIHTEYFIFTNDYIIMMLLIVPTWLLLLQLLDLTSIPRTRSYMSMFFNFLNFSSIGFILIFLYKHIFGLNIVSHYFIIAFSIINLVSLYTFRLITYRFLKYFRSNGHNIHNAIVLQMIIRKNN
ncbi:MAG: hypothetical protein HC906_01955 [Bacteroidales bacterium]|nr:hypothetical protein [Bacteroidales bacterium]